MPAGRHLLLCSALLALLASGRPAPDVEGVMATQSHAAWDPLTPLFYLSDNPEDAYTISDSFTHNLVLGQTGGGKSSTTARLLLSNMARLGYGGFLPCVKVTDAADYLAILRQAGRAQDVIHVRLGDGIPYRINFLEYEQRRSGQGIDQVLVHLVSNMQEVIERGRPTGGGDAFWRQSTQKLIQYGLTVLRAAGLPLSLPSIFKLAVEAPTSPEQRNDPEWRDSSLLYAALKAADEAPKNAIDTRDLETAGSYFLQEHCRMGDITRGSVLATFSAAISPFLVYPLRDLFQTSTNFVPEMCNNGAIILWDIPVMGDSKELAQISTVLMKLIWMRAMERRDVSRHPRPVFLLSDEHQYSYSSHDQLFLTTARSLRVSCTLISQNLSNFYAMLPGDKGRAESDSLFGNLGTKWLHLNTCHVTNSWCANLIGTTRQWFQNVSTALPPAMQPLFNVLGGPRDGSRVTAGMSQQESYEVPPSAFTVLRCGGARHARQVDAVVFTGGRSWTPTGRPWLITTFTQAEQ